VNLTKAEESIGGKYNLPGSQRFSFPTGLLKGLLILTILVVALFVLDKVQHDTVLTLADTRPIAQIAALVLGGVALWAIGTAGAATVKNHRQIAWRMSLRMVGWVGVVCSATALAVFIAQPNNASGTPIGGAARSVAVIIPLVMGIQAAFLLSPEDEPGLEVLLACPRHISWVLLERLVVVLLSQAGVTLVGMAASMVITGERDMLSEAARWLPPALFFSGVSVYITLASRQPAFSVAVTGILWFVFNFVGGALLPGQPTVWPLNLVQPFMWSIHPYLQPYDLMIGDWWVNRALVAALGIVFIAMTVRRLQDEERVLLGGAKAKKQSKGGE